MRPVEKGTAPNVYPKYQDAIGDLEQILGLYCSYCERRFPAGLEVEHVSPKSRGGALTEWSNLLLGCKTCNTAKGAKPASTQSALWPDIDNTLLALCYSAGGFVAVETGLSPSVNNLAGELVALVKLDRHAGTKGKKPTKRDKRWSQREAIWKTATDTRLDYEKVAQSHPQEALKLVGKAAAGYGFFSVWMTVFHDLPLVRVRLISEFKGTALSCFDNNGAPVGRPHGRI